MKIKHWNIKFKNICNNKNNLKTKYKNNMMKNYNYKEKLINYNKMQKN